MRALIACLWLCAAGMAAADPVFTDMSDRLPPHVYDGGWEHFVGGGVAVFDCNGDARPDIFAAGGTNPAMLAVNRGEFRFDLPGDAPAPTGVTGAYPLDIDGDGILDLYVLRAGPDRVLRGNGDCTFRDMAADLSLAPGDRWSTAFSAWWAPGDARPTLAVGHYVDRTDPEGPFGTCDSHLILSPGPDGYTARDLAPGFCTLSMLAARDARGKPTLRISNDRHYYLRGGHEQMYDLTERRFLGPEDGWPDVSLWGMGIASRDLTGDGLAEVMLTSMGDQMLQLAEDGGYVAAPFSIGTYAQRPHTGEDGRPSTGWHAEFGDMDNDARPDLFIAKGNVDQMPGLAIEDPNNLLMQQEDGTFAEAASEAGIASPHRSRGAALADFDGDGRLDLVVVNRRAGIELYRNDTASGHWLSVALRQKAGNTRAVGALITVTADGTRQVQEMTVGGGHAGGSALPLHFGLGSATTADVSVTWPDGTTDRTGPVTADRVLIIHR